MSSVDQETTLLLNYLRAMEEETNFLLDNGSQDSPRTVSIEDLQNRLKALKEKIKNDAQLAYKATKDEASPSIAGAIIEPALRQASANFTMRSNTKPFTSQWTNGLYDLQTELSYHRFMLESHIKNDD